MPKCGTTSAFVRFVSVHRTVDIGRMPYFAVQHRLHDATRQCAADVQALTIRPFDLLQLAWPGCARPVKPQASDPANQPKIRFFDFLGLQAQQKGRGKGDLNGEKAGCDLRQLRQAVFMFGVDWFTEQSTCED